MRYILNEARIVTPHDHFIGALVIENGVIADIQKGKLFNEGISLKNSWLTPGCIDIHSDYLEKEIHPRPSADFPIPFAFHFMDQRAAACGLTTLFSAISFSDNEKSNRTYAAAVQRSNALSKLAGTGMIRHYIHARLDPNSSKVVDYLEDMKQIPALKLVVVNESIPGQRQFRLEDLVAKRAERERIPLEESKKLILTEIAERSRHDKTPEIQAAFAGIVPLGSHDDTTVQHVDKARQFGGTLSEMPTTIEAARRAKELGLWVCMGAPNYVRGGSHCGNLACKDAMAENLVDMICSDYHFPTMLTSVLKMIREGISPSAAVAYVSLNPARFLEIDHETGSIEVGKKADLVAFRSDVDFAKVSHLWVDGRLKFMAAAREIQIPIGQSIKLY